MGRKKGNSKSRQAGMAMPVQGRPLPKQGAQYYPERDAHRYFDHMTKKMGMSDHAGRGFCNQIFKPGEVHSRVYLPSSLQHVAQHASTTNANTKTALLSGGVVMSAKKRVTVVASSAAGNWGVLLINCDRVGFNDSAETLVSGTGNAWVGGGLPTTAAAGLTTMATASQLPWPEQSEEDAVKAVVLGQSVRVLLNSAQANARKGTMFAGWLPHNAGQTNATLQTIPGQQEYDLALLTPEAQVEILRPPVAMAVNNEVSGDSIDYASSGSGFLYLLFSGANSGDGITVEISTTVYYFGSRITPQVTPIFSTAGYDCVLSCWIAVMGPLASYYVSRKGGIMSRLLKEAEVHGAHHTPSGLLHTLWSGVKSFGKWSLSELSQALPGLVAGLL